MSYPFRSTGLFTPDINGTAVLNLPTAGVSSDPIPVTMLSAIRFTVVGASMVGVTFGGSDVVATLDNTIELGRETETLTVPGGATHFAAIAFQAPGGELGRALKYTTGHI